MEFNFEMQVKENRKGFFKHTAEITNTRDNVGSLLNEVGALVTKGYKEGDY